jgi:hypothetical protein
MHAAHRTQKHIPSLSAEIFLLNRSSHVIRVEGNRLGSPIILRPGSWTSRLVRRGTDVGIATWDLGQCGFEICVDVPRNMLIDRCRLTIPSELGNSPLWCWDGLDWDQLDCAAIHDLSDNLQSLRRQHRVIEN